MKENCISCIHLQVQQWDTGVIIFNAMIHYIHSTLKNIKSYSNLKTWLKITSECCDKVNISVTTVSEYTVESDFLNSLFLQNF